LVRGHPKHIKDGSGSTTKEKKKKTKKNRRGRGFGREEYDTKGVCAKGN
jgi:hypothetical protein